MLDKISNKFQDIFRDISGKSTITEKNIEETVEEIKLALLEADVNLRVVRRFVNRTISEAKGETVLRSVNPGQQFVKIVHDKLVQLLGDERQELDLKGPDTVSVILMMGLQGAGKTTASAKLAKRLKADGRRPMLAACDLVRPAAVRQLSVLAEQVSVPVMADEDAKNPQKVLKAALNRAKKEQYDVLIVDTSGRLHVDDALMKELSDLKKIADPSETLFVADSMTGQQGVNIAKEFHEKIGISGVILTKFDSDTRGGAALSVKSVTGQAIKYVGTGEKLDDLDIFYPDRMASRILGMGDVVSLVEKAQEHYDEQEAQELEKKIKSASFTLEDYLDQFQKMKKMGSMQKLLEMIPGASNLPEGAVDEKEMKREEAIILSMTLQERQNHRIIGPSRRKRIAAGSGTAVFEVNKLLKKFEKTRLMMKKVAKNKKYQAQMLSQFGAQ
jgi:signal recognition particle subunit SRP54